MAVAGGTVVARGRFPCGTYLITFDHTGAASGATLGETRQESGFKGREWRAAILEQVGFKGWGWRAAILEQVGFKGRGWRAAILEQVGFKGWGGGRRV